MAHVQGQAKEKYLESNPEPQGQHEGSGQQHKMDPHPVDDVLHDGTKYKPAGKLEGKKAIITGGDSGIGRAVALLFALEGADLTIQYLHEEKKDMDIVRKILHERAPNRKHHCIPLDLKSKDSCETLVAEHMKMYGSLDTLVLNHATQDVQKEFNDITADQWLNTFDVNIHGHFYITKAAVPHMKKGSTITMNASVNHFKGNPDLIDYSATKGAMVAFARSLSQAFVKEKGIRVNVVAPGPIWTPLIVATFKDEKQEKFGTNVPMGRPGQPIEVATCFVFLASPDSSYLSGQTLHPNGGNILGS